MRRLLLLGLCGCNAIFGIPSNITVDQSDGGSRPDAPVNLPDAHPGVFDALPSMPDARLNTADARPGTPDARPQPDAMPAQITGVKVNGIPSTQVSQGVNFASIEVDGTGFDTSSVSSGIGTASLTSSTSTQVDFTLVVPTDAKPTTFTVSLGNATTILTLTPIQVTQAGIDSGNGTPDSPYGSLSRAFSQAGDGTEVDVGAGTFNGSFVSNGAITVRGVAGQTFIKGTDPSMAVIAVNANSGSTVAFSGLQLEAPCQNGIHANSPGIQISLDSSVIQGCSFGLYVDGNSDIFYVTSTQFIGGGLEIGGSSNGVTLSGSTMNGGQTCVHIGNTFNSQVVVSNTTFENCSTSAIHISDFGTPVSGSLNVSGSTFTVPSSATGIFIEGSLGSTIVLSTASSPSVLNVSGSFGIEDERPSGGSAIDAKGTICNGGPLSGTITGPSTSAAYCWYIENMNTLIF